MKRIVFQNMKHIFKFFEKNPFQTDELNLAVDNEEDVSSLSFSLDVTIAFVHGIQFVYIFVAQFRKLSNYFQFSFVLENEKLNRY